MLLPDVANEIPLLQTLLPISDDRKKNNERHNMVPRVNATIIGSNNSYALAPTAMITLFRHNEFRVNIWHTLYDVDVHVRCYNNVWPGMTRTNDSLSLKQVSDGFWGPNNIKNIPKDDYIKDKNRQVWDAALQPLPRKRSAMIFSDDISDTVSCVNESDHFVVTIGTDTRKHRSTALHRWPKTG